MTPDQLEAAQRAPAARLALLRARWLAPLAVAVLAVGHPARAGATGSAPTPISSCDESTLQADLSAGGSYAYAQDCTVTLTTQLVSSAKVSISSGGHSVTIEQPSSVEAEATTDTRVLHVTGGSLTLTGITLSGGEVYPGFLGNGTGGTSGTSPSTPTTPGASGGNGTAGTDAPDSPQGPAVEGGCVLIEAGALVTLDGDTLSGCTASGADSANGGDGGEGGGGASGAAGESPGQDEGPGGRGGNGGDGAGGGNGGNGGTGGDASGGAIYNAGTLIVTNTTFSNDQALGGPGGWGGQGGDGGGGGFGGNGGEGGGSSSASAGSAGGPGGTGGNALGQAGTGGDGGNGGNGQGGAIYDSGTLIVSGSTTFSDDQADGGWAGLAGLGGPGGPGGQGGDGGGGGVGTMTSGPSGAGGDGGNGSGGANSGNAGDGGDGDGGAIFYASGSSGNEAPASAFSGNSAVAGPQCGGTSPPVTDTDCGTDDFTGFPGFGGSGGTGSSTGSTGSPGPSTGSDGSDGAVGDAEGDDTDGTPSPVSAAVAVAVSPKKITADGRAQATATATVTTGGNPLPGQDVAFTSSDSDVSIGAVTDNGDGTYTVTITSSHIVGSPTITATDDSDQAQPSGSAQLAQAAPSIKVSVKPTSIPADGKTTAAVTVTLVGVAGEPVPGEHVTLTATGPASAGSVTDEGNGSYTSVVTASHTAGHATITATDDSVSPSVSATAQLTLKAVKTPPKKKMCIVPGLKGDTLAGAKAALKHANCTEGKETKANSATITSGHVISSSPKAGSKSKAGTKVNLTVSKGPKPTPKTCIVPKLPGDTLAAAKTALKHANCAEGKETKANSATIASGHVISSSPKAGSKSKAGTKVNLTVSKGPKPKTCIVPKLKGDTLAGAKTALKHANCGVGKVTNTNSTKVAKGHVISSSPKAGSKSKAGTKVKLTVSKGP